jgi:hypothetical protein
LDRSAVVDDTEALEDAIEWFYDLPHFGGPWTLVKLEAWKMEEILSRLHPGAQEPAV